MNDLAILKRAINAAFHSPKFLHHELNGPVRIPFTAPFFGGPIYFMIYNPEKERIDSIECPDGRFIDLTEQI